MIWWKNPDHPIRPRKHTRTQRGPSNRRCPLARSIKLLPKCIFPEVVRGASPKQPASEVFEKCGRLNSCTPSNSVKDPQTSDVVPTVGRAATSASTWPTTTEVLVPRLRVFRTSRNDL